MGEMIKENRYLTDEEIDNNALNIASYLKSKNWSDNAIAGTLANMWKESNCNPGLWEGLEYGNTSVGYGLVQWTPGSIVINWLQSHGYAIDDYIGQLEKICEEVTDGSQWITTSFSSMTFEEYIVSDKEPSYLAEVFIKNYERPADSNQPDRYEKANYFFELIKGVTPTPSGKKIKLKFPYDLRFNKISFVKNEFELVKNYGNVCKIKNLLSNRYYLVKKSFIGTI